MNEISTYPKFRTGSLSLSLSLSSRLPSAQGSFAPPEKEISRGAPFRGCSQACSCSRHERVGLFCGAVIVPGPLLFPPPPPPPLPLSYAKSCATSLPAAFVPLFRLFFRHSCSQLCARRSLTASLSLSLSLSPLFSILPYAALVAAVAVHQVVAVHALALPTYYAYSFLSTLRKSGFDSTVQYTVRRSTGFDQFRREARRASA